MTDRNEVRKAHEIVDKIYPLYERETLRKLLPPRPEVTFGETIEELKGLASEDDMHLWAIIRQLERFEKSYSATPVVESEALPFKDAPATEPAHPEFLETETDYRYAPVGTVVTMDGVGSAWVKEQYGWPGIRDSIASSAYTMAGLRRRVLRWGWGSD